MKKKPKLGQHFLIDPSASAAIADALGEVSGETVIEIGPGEGAITEILAARTRRLIAVELDRDLTSRLRARFPAIEIVEADILSVDLSAFRTDRGNLRVIGNLPYYITSPILMRLFEQNNSIATAVLMMQREVADRVAAVPGSRDYGLLSATAQMYARIERILDLPPEAFMPPPEVHSTVLRLTMHPRFAGLGVEPQAFLNFLRQCFAQKRKILSRNLRASGFSQSHIAYAFTRAETPAIARAEELSLEQMGALWRALQRD